MDKAAKVLLGLAAFVVCADRVLPGGVLAGKGVLAALIGVAVLLAGMERVRANKDARWLVGPALGLALWAGASLLWTVDAAATVARAKHLSLEVLWLGALAILWSRDRRAALGVGGFVACAALLLGFGIELQTGEGARLRPYGIHPNLAARDAVLGALLVLLIPRGHGGRGVGAAAMGGLAAGLSFSSGAVLAMLGAVGVLGLRRRWRGVVASFVVTACLGGAVLTLSAQDAPKRRTPATAVQGSAIEEIGSGRLVLWGHALRVTQEHGALGAGAGAFPAAMEPIRAAHQAAGGEHSKPRRRAHNSFLELLAELGPVGLALFVTPLAWAARQAWRRRDELAGAFVAFTALSAMTDSLLQQKSLWLALAVCVLLGAEERAGEDPAVAEPHQGEPEPA